MPCRWPLPGPRLQRGQLHGLLGPAAPRHAGHASAPSHCVPGHQGTAVRAQAWSGCLYWSLLLISRRSLDESFGLSVPCFSSSTEEVGCKQTKKSVLLDCGTKPSHYPGIYSKSPRRSVALLLGAYHPATARPAVGAAHRPSGETPFPSWCLGR